MMYPNSQRDPTRPFPRPPPPPAVRNLAQSYHTNTPNIPPPPRYAFANGVPIPPPPGPPPGTTLGQQTPWQGSWGRPYDNRSAFTMPPTSGPLPYNPTQAHQLPNTTVPSLPPPPPPTSDHLKLVNNSRSGSEDTVMGATYIPKGPTYGGGVGIPGFNYDDMFTYTPVTNPPQPKPAPTKSNGSVAHAEIPNDLAGKWPLDQVLRWLAANRFSKDWQETFKGLDLHGALFLELGSQRGGRGNFGMMHQLVYPRLAQECFNSGTGWDQAREREEGKRMRRLIRSLTTGKPPDSSKAQTQPQYAQSEYLNGTYGHGAGTDVDSPNTPIKPNTGFSHMTKAPTIPITGPTTSESNYRIILKNIDIDSNRKGSPSSASEFGNGIPRRQSPVASPKPPSSLPPSSPASRFTIHRPGNSADSISPNSTRRSSGVPPDVGQPIRNVQNNNSGHGSRLFPMDPSERSTTGAELNLAKDGKESRSLLDMKRKYKDDDRDSPASPGLYGSSSALTNDTGPNSQRTYILVTTDGWNYRMCDVTECNSIRELQMSICMNLGLSDSDSLQMYPTELGQGAHDQPLGDVFAWNPKRTSIGSMKLFLKYCDSSSQVPNLPTTWDSDGHVPSDGQRTRSSSSPPTSRANTMTPHPRPGEEQSTAQVKAHQISQQQATYLAGNNKQTNHHKALTPSVGFVGRSVDFDHPRTYSYDDKQQDILLPQRTAPPPPGVETATLLLVNTHSKKPGHSIKSSQGGLDGVSSLKPSATWSGSFDSSLERSHMQHPTSPSLKTGLTLEALEQIESMWGHPARSSPSTEQQFPKPTNRTNAGQPTVMEYAEQLGKKGAMATVDFGQVASGRSSPRSGSPGSITWSRGDIPFLVPDYTPGGTPTASMDTPQHDQLAKVRYIAHGGVSAADVSPSTYHVPGVTSRAASTRRKSYGPDVDFPDTEVEFDKIQPSSQPAEDSGDDSDEGLFVVPVRGLESSNSVRQMNTSDRGTDSDSGGNGGKKHSLQGRTAKSGKTLSVTFDSLGTMNTPDLDDSEENFNGPHRRTPGTPCSDQWQSDDPLVSRRKSFIERDVWANRPPPEALLSNLDAYFPELDLDQPVLDESQLQGASPPVSPIPEQEEPSPSATTVDIPTSHDRNDEGKTFYHDSDTLGSDESTLKALERPASTVVSTRSKSMRKSGGLGRMKSIREVARGAHEANKRYTNSGVSAATSGSMVQRRKSTKMFGAHVVQIRPERGSTIVPQIPQDILPKRQTTFRWFKGELIGKGTYGRVYLGMNATTGEFLAVKEVEVNQKVAGGDKNKMKELLAALDQEIDTMQNLDHDNIVQYLGCERKETSISIFLEYISGGSIGSCLRKHGKFEEPVVRSLTRQTLSGLAYLHGEGILHRDLKADNILLDLDGTSKISDFGISKKTDDIYGNDKTNSMQGSVFWMAPEVIRSQGEGYSAKVDIWSLGCVVLEMFAGRRPWSKEEAVGAIYKIANGETPPINDEVRAAISPYALGFMLDCFTVDPQDRPTAMHLLRNHSFCKVDDSYNFYDTELYARIRGTFTT
ncbi:hypothetical protein GGS21DRAFT_535225 [Xylaria nigripes]|nr:hypothetical protein GGS21DRAFT_535225 [Xylaria nigripes]